MSDWNPFEPQSPNPVPPTAPNPPHRSSAALRTFLATLSAALIVAFGSLLAVSSASSVVQPQGMSSGSAPSASSQSEPAHSGSASSYVENPLAPQLSLSALPQTSSLTDQQIVKKVRASILSVLVYEQSADSGASGLTGLSQGSGIIMTADGYLLTNAHVLESRSDVYVCVVLLNGETFHASVVGFDTRTDLAVLKADTNGESLPAAEFGDSDSCEIGDPVLAFGNPGGVAYANSVTKGILSATNRFLALDINSLPLLQTDAPINPGNSGGALVNSYGQVIGINSAKVTATDFEGMGFAIPTAQAKTVINQLLRYGRVINRVYLGIRFSPVSELDASLYQIKPGMQVTYFADNSVFTGTEMQVNDIITAVNGTSVKTATDFFAALDKCSPGQPATFSVYRPADKDTSALEYEISVPLRSENG